MHFEIAEQHLLYDGFFRVHRYWLRHALFGGGMSDTVMRECFEPGKSVGVLPYDPQRDEVALIEQFRIGALQHPQGPWVLEAIAGIIEPGETATEVAYREAREEAGCELRELQFISRYLVSPGGNSEEQSVFCGLADTRRLGGVHGLASEGEDIRVHVVSLDEALEMVATGAIHAAQLIIALQWLALNRERLHALWGGDEAISPPA
jgi:ADP-ribose pyrophosphatase